LEDTPQYNLAFSFSVIVVMAVVVMLGVLGVRFYLADKVYASALRSEDLAGAEAKLQKTISLRKGSDIYHVALARVYLLRAGQISQTSQPSVPEVADLLARAVNEAKIATEISPNAVAIWENLVTMYENATALIPAAGEWAIKSLIKASELEPTNAVLMWRLANNYAVANDMAKAVENYQKAIALKKDYLGAYVGLANAYEAQKETDKAVETYKVLLPMASNNSEVLFGFGRLLYNRGGREDRNDAEKLWLDAVRLQPGYSNALYSLGLLYEGRGDRSKALQYYYKVKDINPDNKDITEKIKSLVSGGN